MVDSMFVEMRMSPSISVSVPVYNGEKYLRQCLNSLVNQTLQDIEIIIVNDGSTDSSEAICREYAEKDSRMVLVCKEVTVQYSIAYN